jgi:hypothetical protein
MIRSLFVLHIAEKRGENDIPNPLKGGPMAKKVEAKAAAKKSTKKPAKALAKKK